MPNLSSNLHSRPLRILFVLPAYEPAWHLGGIVRSESTLCRNLVKLGADVTVYTTDSAINRHLDVPVNQPVDVGGVRVHYFQTDYNLRYFYSKALTKACRNTIHNYDLVYVNAVWCYPGLIACQESRKQRIPYIQVPHGSFIPYSLRHKQLKKLIYLHLFVYRDFRMASAIRYTSEYERQMSLMQIRTRTPSFVIPNGIDCNEFSHLPPRDISCGVLDLLPNKRYVGFMGRLHSGKGLDLLLSAFTDAAQSLPDVHLVLAGPDDGYEAVLRTMVQRLGLCDRVHFTGFLNNERRLNLFSVMDLFAFVSSSENFGMVAAEAMAAGVPVLISDHVGLYPNVLSDKAGQVVSSQKDAIAQALISMLSDDAILKEMGQRAYTCAHKRYAAQQVAEQVLIASQDIVSGRRSAGLEWSSI